MSDLFVGEMLILFLLFPVMLRPFFRRLQRIEGCSLLPFLAFLLCIAEIAASGLQISFLPVLLFCLLVLFSGLARLFRFFRHLPTDWYSPVAKVYGAFLLLLFVPVFWLACLYAPESAFFSGKDVHRVTVNQTISVGVNARVTTWTSPSTKTVSGKTPVVILSGDVSSGSGGRRTTAAILAESGYTVIGADFSSLHDYGNPLLSGTFLREFMFRFSDVFPLAIVPSTGEETGMVQSRDLDRLVRLAKTRYGADVRLFVVAEGSACNSALALRREQPDLARGLLCILPADNILLAALPAGESVVISSSSGVMPFDAGSFPVCILSGDHNSLYGFGELAADDPLAAARCGVSRDVGRKQAEFTARRIVSWLSMRSAYDNQ